MGHLVMESSLLSRYYGRCHKGRSLGVVARFSGFGSEL